MSRAPDSPKEALKLKRFITTIIIGFILLGMLLWGTLAIIYSNLPSASLRTTLSWAFAIGSVSLLLFLRPWRRAVFMFLMVFAGVLLWWLSIPPSQNRDWQADVTVASQCGLRRRPSHDPQHS